MKNKYVKKFKVRIKRYKKYLPFLSLAILLVSFTVPLLRTSQVDGIEEAEKISATSSPVSVTPTTSATVAIAAASAAAAQKTAAAATAAKAKAVTTSSVKATNAISISSSYHAAATVSPRGMSLYVDPSFAQNGGPSAITSQPTSTWLGGWTSNVQATVNSIVSAASAQGSLATLVLYNIPGRDCGSYSSGGLSSVGAYNSWVSQIAAGIGQRQAIVIIEPDALAQIDTANCLSASQQADRYAMLSNAVSVLASQTKAFTYLDAGNSSWVSASSMASRLQQANIAQARGFALNVSNFQTTASNTNYGNQLSSALNKSFVIDTGRNGKGSNGDWCNPSGRGLGARPTTSVGGNVDAYLWIKTPGESDGTCNGGPSAGAWWQQYAESLVANQ